MFSETDSMCEDQEPSILDYARYHGLSYDPEHDDDEDFDFNLIAAASSSADHDASDEPIDFVVDGGFLDEKLILDADARAVLAFITQCQQPPMINPLELDIRCTKYVRLEEPLLLTDPKLDVKQYIEHRAAAETDFHIDIDKLPLFEIDEASEEGLAWPEKYQSLPAEYDKHIADEKIQVPKETLLFLHQVCHTNDMDEHIFEFMDSELKYRRNKALQPLTPPLSPYLSAPSSPDSSSPMPKPTAHTIWSDASTRNENDDTFGLALVEEEDILGLLEAALEKDINDPIMTDELIQLYSPLKQRYSQERLSSSSPLRRTSRLKVEPPMSPFYRPPPPSSDELKLDKLPLWSLVNSQPLDEEIKTTFETYIEPAALRVQDTILNERLVDPYITERLPVPLLDFSAPTATWHVRYTEQEEEDELRRIKLPIAKSNLHHWSASKLENRLRWNPFPAFQQPNLDEDIKDCGLLDKFLKLDLEDCVNTKTLTWKPDGLRILDDGDEEDLLSEAESDRDNPAHEPPSGIDELLIQVEQATVVTHEHRPSYASRSSPLLVTSKSGRPSLGSRSSPVPLQTQPKSLVREALDFSTLLQARQPAGSADAVGGDALSASHELSRFMNLQGQHTKRRKLEHSSSILPSPVRAVATQKTHFVAGKTPVAAMVNPTAPDEMELKDLPAIPAYLPDRQIIASETLTANTQLFRQVAKLYPNLDIIERDSKVHQQPALRSMTASSSHGLQSNSAKDNVDIILSPSHGMLITNIARLHQLPLPGSASSPNASVPGHTVRAQITAASTCFRQLTVIVNCTAFSVDKMNQHDTKVLASLRTFAMQVQDDIWKTKVEIVIASGGVEGLAHYMIKVIAESRYQSQVQLLAEEIMWEGRLRLAGMNAWAAQMVLACLDVEDGGGEAKVWDAARRLVAMNAQEKVHMLSQAMGDEAMAGRVCSVLNRLFQ